MDTHAIPESVAQVCTDARCHAACVQRLPWIILQHVAVCPIQTWVLLDTNAKAASASDNDGSDANGAIT